MKPKSAYTLIELLIVIAILGVLAAMSAFLLSGAQKGARDSRRKADLETIRSGLELYRADCDSYPQTSALVAGAALTGTSATPGARCSTSNKYISVVPTDPKSYIYRYARLTTTTYELCATQEKAGTLPVVTCGGQNCGPGINCYYQVKNP